MKSFPLALAALATFIWLADPISSISAAGPPYKAQESRISLGQTEVLVTGPENFIRIDGLDRNLDDILLATQSPAAAILGIFAEPGAWKEFQAAESGPTRAGLHCHAIISTPAPLAERTVTRAEFEDIGRDLIRNMSSLVNKERRMEGDLAGISDHQVESAIGRIESFTVLNQGPDHLTYRFESVLEMKLKGAPAPRISRTATVSSTLLFEGKIINLQLMADPQGPPVRQLERIAGVWRNIFSRP